MPRLHEERRARAGDPGALGGAANATRLQLSEPEMRGKAHHLYGEAE
jgi:hypothetical protein